ncbi:unnamed protein product [Medioppia subpectinata]|uniref:Phosphatidic acid phosphatase type 2/haloperoxidase domain-containing protein n=1 Tax=Medioppia subpectinata TaxID=1979941 RepID=A0A7R9L375_9ACAR|nr:unnamed protein product [Medioppia subpectinata]CAG2113590.1 unnamed protein product [Medioppia subpectinata]
MRVGIKVLIVLFVLIAFVSIIIEPKHNGFHCNDSSIRQPFNALQITLAQLLTIAMIIPVIVVIVIENVAKSVPKTQIKTIIYQNINAFIFGLFANFLAVMVAKNLIGRLRPHAIHFCNADHYCADGVNDKYIESFECVNKDYHGHFLKNVRHSFYSGHASIATYSGIFLILYLNSRLKPQMKPIKYILLALFAAIAITSLYPGYTQWHNSWHFLSDVLTGYTIGLISGSLVFKFLVYVENSEQLNASYIPLNKLLSTISGQ